MKIRGGFDIVYDCPQATPKQLMLSIHPSRVSDLLTPHCIRFEPAVEARDYVDGFGNTCTRIVAPAGKLRMLADFIIADSGKPDVVVPTAKQHRVEDLPDCWSIS